jgi:hypothetical protein
MTTNVVDVSVPVGFNELYCPVCGREVCGPGDNEDQPKCKHVVFVHLDIADTFLYVAPAYSTIVGEAQDAHDDGDDVDPVQYVLDQIAAINAASVVCLAATSELGKLCVAIDFDPEDDEYEEPVA